MYVLGICEYLCGFLAPTFVLVYVIISSVEGKAYPLVTLNQGRLSQKKLILGTNIHHLITYFCEEIGRPYISTCRITEHNLCFVRFLFLLTAPGRF